jgi:hypothetical protein
LKPQAVKDQGKGLAACLFDLAVNTHRLLRISARTRSAQLNSALAQRIDSRQTPPQTRSSSAISRALLGLGSANATVATKPRGIAHPPPLFFPP